MIVLGQTSGSCARSASSAVIARHNAEGLNEEAALETKASGMGRVPY